MCVVYIFLQVVTNTCTVRALQYTRVIVPCPVVIWGAAWRSVPTALPISPHLGCFEKVIQITWQNVEQIRMKGSLEARFNPLRRISLHSWDSWSSLQCALLKILQLYINVVSFWKKQKNKSSLPLASWFFGPAKAKRPSRTHNGLRPSRLICCVVDGQAK